METETDEKSERDTYILTNVIVPILFISIPINISTLPEWTSSGKWISTWIRTHNFHNVDRKRRKKIDRERHVMVSCVVSCCYIYIYKFGCANHGAHCHQPSTLIFNYARPIPHWHLTNRTDHFEFVNN